MQLCRGFVGTRERQLGADITLADTSLELQMVRIGIDLERIERFAFMQKGSGNEFYQRVYTPAEDR